MLNQTDQMASLSSLAARKAIFLEALILIDSPVAGLRPIRAARLRTCRMPRPESRILLPFLRLAVIISTTWVTSSLAWRLGSSCAVESDSAMWRSVRIGEKVIPAEDFERLAAPVWPAAFDVAFAVPFAGALPADLAAVLAAAFV